MTALYIANALWFGAAFWYFGLAPASAAKILVSSRARGEAMFPTLVASVRFLGGMNLALSVFAVLLLVCGSLFPEPKQAALFCGVFGLAHATQLAFNVPVLLRERRGDMLWRVTRGPMRFIFIVDGTLAAANLLFAVYVLAH